MLIVAFARALRLSATKSVCEPAPKCRENIIKSKATRALRLTTASPTAKLAEDFIQIRLAHIGIKALTAAHAAKALTHIRVVEHQVVLGAFFSVLERFIGVIDFTHFGVGIG